MSSTNIILSDNSKQPFELYEKRHEESNYNYTNISAPNSLAVYLVNTNKILNNSVLELGCGSGRDLLYFAKHGASVVGVDISLTALQKVLQNKKLLKIQKPIGIYHDDFISFLKQNLKQNDSYDLIYSYSNLHYFDDKELQSLLKNIHGSLNKNGSFAFAIKTNNDNFKGKGKLIDPEIQLWKGKDGIPRRFFTKENITKILRRSSFSISYCEKIILDGYDVPSKKNEFFHIIAKKDIVS